MTIRQILVDPDPRLRQVSQPVPPEWPGLKQLVEDMTQTLAASGGIGLAAPQIGEPWRVVLVDLSAGKHPPMVLVDPVITLGRGHAQIEEGCLSVPGRRIRVPRLEKIQVLCKDIQGRQHRIPASGLLSICIQHEIDHLDGRLILDAEQSAPTA